ncbi:MAG: hypothetical protein WCA35_07695, partial [Kovacikia sp.]
MEYYANTLRPAGMTPAQKRAYNTQRVKTAQADLKQLRAQAVTRAAGAATAQKQAAQRDARARALSPREVNTLRTAYDSGDYKNRAAARIINKVHGTNRTKGQGDVQRGSDMQDILYATGG